MTRRQDVQTILARCYVAMAEVDFDLRAWDDELHPPARVIDLRRATPRVLVAR